MWIQALLFFLVGLVGASIFAAPSYFLGRWLRRIEPSSACLGDYLVAALGLVVFNWTLVIVIPFCICAASATQALERKQGSRFYRFVQMLSSTALPYVLLVATGLFFISLSQEVRTNIESALKPVVTLMNAWFASGGPESETAFFVGAYLGLSLTCCVIPIFSWLWHSSNLRPGLDRPLRHDEANA